MSNGSPQPVPMPLNTDFERASQDQGFAHAFWLLTQIPQAARQSDFADQLKRLGLKFRASRRSWRSSERSRTRLIAMFAHAATEAISARWRNTLLPKR